MQAAALSKQLRSLFSAAVIFFLLCVIPCAGRSSGTEKNTNKATSETSEFTAAEFRLAPSEQRSAENLPLFTLRRQSNQAYLRKLSLFHTKDMIKESNPLIFENMRKKIHPHRFENTLYTASLLTLTALHAADYFSTIVALQRSDLKEGNPLLKPFTKNLVVFSTVKLGLIVCDFYILKKIHQKNKTIGWILSLIGNAAMSYVVSNNIRKLQNATNH